MKIFLNGRFVPEDRARISVLDRGFLYGDGLFEGLLITHGRPFRWPEHFARLRRGLNFLKLALPYSSEDLRVSALRLVKLNNMPEGILRLSVSRGITARGYSPKNAKHPAIVMTLHPVVEAKQLPRWRVIISSFRLLADDPLTGFKTANKLPQVMSRAQAGSTGAMEAILLNHKGRLAEGTTSNLFWIKRGTVFTPPLTEGALPGVTRACVLELCARLRIKAVEKKARPADLRQADGAFLTMTSFGVVEIASLDGRKLKKSPLVKKLWAAYYCLLIES